ncbi:hypothetical protein BJY52DRAFT_1225226 [Lactarius psammicola]|nr:hypothetical protein BJY52DRAFT_1225226 [Lactarius psammicola]
MATAVARQSHENWDQGRQEWERSKESSVRAHQRALRQPNPVLFLEGKQQAWSSSFLPMNRSLRAQLRHLLKYASCLRRVSMDSTTVPQWGVEASLQDSCAATIGAQSARGKESTTASRNLLTGFQNSNHRKAIGWRRAPGRSV